jgi:transposase
VPTIVSPISPAAPVFVGIDVAKAHLDAGFLHDGRTARFPYDTPGLAALVALLLPLRPQLIVLEASGGFERKVAAELIQAGLNVSVVNPRNVRDFAKACGKLAKNDQLDALILARFAQQIQPRLSPLVSAEQASLTELALRRKQLVSMRASEANRLAAATTPKTRRSIARVVALLDREIDDLDEALAALVQANATWSQTHAIITSVPGVGDTTSFLLLAQLVELGRLNRQQIAALVGLAPYDSDSGKFKGTRSIWGGRAAVRCGLYMATLAARRFNPLIKRFAARLELKGKPFKVVMVACMRKLLTLLNSMVKNKTLWKPEPAV